MIDDVEKYKV